MKTIPISLSMRDYVAAHPDQKYLFFGGKGGVGKTVMAGAAAVGMAKMGRHTLLASTNPVHSLSGLLDQNVFGKPTPVEGVPNLTALEIDTKDTIERSKLEIREKIDWFLKYAEIRGQADDFIETATMNPAFEESAMFENMIDLIFDDEYESYVFDTAPTANARRLLGMSSVYSLWVNKMMESRKEAQVTRLRLSYTKKEEKDPLMDYLISFRQRMFNAKEILTDPEKTAFYFVTLPEALPIAVIKRFIGWFHDFGVPVGGVVVNMVLDPELLKGEVDEFVRNRVEMQAGYMEQIEREFENSVRAVLPLFDTEVRGVPMLTRMADSLFA